MTVIFTCGHCGASEVCECSQLAAAVPKRFGEALTKREEEVAGLVGAGMRNHEIAGLLHISLSTVKSHLNSIFRKLEIHSRHTLALRVIAQKVAPS